MKLIALTLVLMHLVAGIHGFSFFSQETTNPCDISTEAWIPYTGYRILRQVTLIPKPGYSILTGLFTRRPKYDIINHLVIAKCDRGHAKYEAVTRVQDGFDTNYHHGLTAPGMWNTTVCTANTLPQELTQQYLHEYNKTLESQSKHYWFDREDVRSRHSRESPDCYRMARRLKFMENQDNPEMLIPGTVVGALYQCVQLPYQSLYQSDYVPSCTPENVQPVLPLIADKPYHIWSYLDGVVDKHKHGKTGGGFTIRIPLFFTPDIMNKQYPRMMSHWAANDGTRNFRYPVFQQSHKLDRNWARSIDPFEEYVDSIGNRKQ